MTTTFLGLRRLASINLIRDLREASRSEPENPVRFLLLLGEFDRRGLFGALGHRSLHEFCSRRLGDRQESATRHVALCRILRRFPTALSRVLENRVSLDALYGLSRHLNEANYLLLLRAAERHEARDLRALIDGASPDGESLARLSRRSLIRPMG